MRLELVVRQQVHVSPNGGGHLHNELTRLTQKVVIFAFGNEMRAINAVWTWCATHTVLNAPTLACQKEGVHSSITTRDCRAKRNPVIRSEQTCFPTGEGVPMHCYPQIQLQKSMDQVDGQVRHVVRRTDERVIPPYYIVFRYGPSAVKHNTKNLEFNKRISGRVKNPAQCMTSCCLSAQSHRHR